MPATTQPRYYRRVFLNRERFHSGAHMIARFDPDRYISWLRISDCDRVIQLEFQVDSAGELRNSLHKADALVFVAAGFRDALHEYAREQKQPAMRRRSS